MAKGEAAVHSGVAKELIECGIIMPIAAMAEYSESHWQAMLELISRGVRKAGMQPEPVWENGPADVLQERIVRNLYEQPYAVCDVSGLNPNVMLELGIRLAFGKPTIIVSDGLIRTPFDIGPAEYLPYDRSLHYRNAEDFVERLAAKIQTVKSAVDQQNYRPYIKTFGPIELGAPGNETVPLGQAVLDQLASLAADVRSMKPIALGNIRKEVSLGQASMFDIGDMANAITFKVNPKVIDLVRDEIIKYFPGGIVFSPQSGIIGFKSPERSPIRKSQEYFKIKEIIAEAEADLALE